MVPRHAAAPLETLQVTSSQPATAPEKHPECTTHGRGFMTKRSWNGVTFWACSTCTAVFGESIAHVTVANPGAEAELARVKAELEATKKQRRHVAQILGGITMESTEGGDNVDRLADLTLTEVERLRTELLLAQGERDGASESAEEAVAALIAAQADRDIAEKITRDGFATARREREANTYLVAALSDLYEIGRQESIEDGDLEAAQANARAALKFARDNDAPPPSTLRAVSVATIELAKWKLTGGGFCSAVECGGHCGFVHLRGCAAVKDYLKQECAEALAALTEVVP